MNKTKSNGLLTLHNHGFEFQIWLCMSSEYIVVGNKILKKQYLKVFPAIKIYI